MKIRLLRDCIVRGASASAGDILDLSNGEAHGLINIRKAVAFAPEPQPFPLPERQTEPVVEHRDPEIAPAKRRGRPPKSHA